MFYIYDVNGMRFKGSLETLEAQRRVARRPAVLPFQEGGRSTTFSISAKGQSSKGQRSKGQAFAAYQHMIERENMIEPLVHIYQIMSFPVSAIGLDIPLVNAWWMLKESNFRQLVVISARRQVISLLSDRDLLRHIRAAGDAVEVERELTVGEILPAETITTDSKSDIRRVARAMAYFHKDAMPVLEEERLVGIVTRGDILRGFAENPKLNLWG